MEEIGKLKRQFTMLVSGQSAGGKTQFVKQLINTPDIFEEYPSKIIISYQANPAQYKDLSDVELCYGLPNIEELCELPGIKLLVLDDATQLISNKKNELIDLFTIKSHHNSLSCILICHNPFLQDLRTIREALIVLLICFSRR
jgi:septin family protein